MLCVCFVTKCSTSRSNSTYHKVSCLGQTQTSMHPCAVINKNADDRHRAFKNAQKTIGGIVMEYYMTKKAEMTSDWKKACKECSWMHLPASCALTGSRDAAELYTTAQLANSRRPSPGENCQTVGSKKSVAYLLSPSLASGNHLIRLIRAQHFLSEWGVSARKPLARFPSAIQYLRVRNDRCGREKAAVHFSTGLPAPTLWAKNTLSQKSSSDPRSQPASPAGLAVSWMDSRKDSEGGINTRGAHP